MSELDIPLLEMLNHVSVLVAKSERCDSYFFSPKLTGAVQS